MSNGMMQLLGGILLCHTELVRIESKTALFWVQVSPLSTNAVAPCVLTDVLDYHSSGTCGRYLWCKFHYIVCG